MCGLRWGSLMFGLRDLDQPERPSILRKGSIPLGKVMRTRQKFGNL